MAIHIVGSSWKSTFGNVSHLISSIDRRSLFFSSPNGFLQFDSFCFVSFWPSSTLHSVFALLSSIYLPAPSSAFPFSSCILSHLCDVTSVRQGNSSCVRLTLSHHTVFGSSSHHSFHSHRPPMSVAISPQWPACTHHYLQCIHSMYHRLDFIGEIICSCRIY